MKKWFLLSFLCSFFLVANAKNVFPAHCKPMHFQFANEQLTLQAHAKQNVFLLQNISQQTIWLDHAKKSPSASAGWESQLNAGNWSAIVLTSRPQNFVLSCASQQFQKLDCKRVLQVCELQKTKLAAQGSYWITENKLLSQTLTNLKQRGFYSNSR